MAVLAEQHTEEAARASIPLLAQLSRQLIKLGLDHFVNTANIVLPAVDSGDNSLARVLEEEGESFLPNIILYDVSGNAQPGKTEVKIADAEDKRFIDRSKDTNARHNLNIRITNGQHHGFVNVGIARESEDLVAVENYRVRRGEFTELDFFQKIFVGRSLDQDWVLLIVTKDNKPIALGQFRFKGDWQTNFVEAVQQPEEVEPETQAEPGPSENGNGNGTKPHKERVAQFDTGLSAEAEQILFSRNPVVIRTGDSRPQGRQARLSLRAASAHGKDRERAAESAKGRRGNSRGTHYK